MPTLDLRHETWPIRGSFAISRGSRTSVEVVVAELADGALKRRILLFPVATPGDILAHRQLAARDYYDRIEHSDIGETVTYPGHFVKDMQDAARVGVRRRAPHVGEHNREILGGELGLNDRDLARLSELGVV